MLIDIFMTYKDRSELFENSFNSFIENTEPGLYRLTVVCDNNEIPDFIKNSSNVEHILLHKENIGLAPSINQALSHIETLNNYYSDKRVDSLEHVSDFICYLQDDILYTKDWLEKLTKYFLMFETHKKIGFASGIECIEHKQREEIGVFGNDKVITKDWIRATCMFARRNYWMSMFPIPMFDPETQRERAKPNDNIGSGVDWHFIRNHKNSVCKTSRTNIVVAGLLQHLGYNKSGWLNRELPESEFDKNKMQTYYLDELTNLSCDMDIDYSDINEAAKVIIQPNVNYKAK